MSPIWIITGKEVRDSLRNRWVLAATLLLAALALSLGFLGSSPTGSVKADPLTITVVSLSSLSIFLIPLIAMLLAYDAVIGEIERGTMALLLSYPVWFFFLHGSGPVFFRFFLPRPFRFFAKNREKHRRLLKIGLQS